MVAPQKIVMPCAHAMLQLYLTALGNNSHRLRDTADLQGLLFWNLFFHVISNQHCYFNQVSQKKFFKIMVLK